MKKNNVKSVFPVGVIVLAAYILFSVFATAIWLLVYMHNSRIGILELLDFSILFSVFENFQSFGSLRIGGNLGLNCFMLIVALVLMFCKRPQAVSVVFGVMSCLTFVQVLFTVFIYFSFTVYGLAPVLSNLFIWLAFLTLAVIGLDTFKLFKRVTVSYAWVLPAFFALASIPFTLLYDSLFFLRYTSYQAPGFFAVFYMLSAYFCDISSIIYFVLLLFKEILFAASVFAIGLWFFNCAKAKAASIKTLQALKSNCMHEEALNEEI